MNATNIQHREGIFMRRFAAIVMSALAVSLAVVGPATTASASSSAQQPQAPCCKY
jgi:hypothetical protein